MKTAEIITPGSKYILAYKGSSDSQLGDKTFYSIEISDYDINIQSLNEFSSTNPSNSIHLLRVKDTRNTSIVGTQYMSEDKEYILVIETAIEIILVYYDQDTNKAQKISVFRKCTIGQKN